MAGYLKKSTGLTGLAVDPLSARKLGIIYKDILKICGAMPQSYSYRQHTEQLVKDRLNVVQAESDMMQAENKINGGQMEELVLQAERELSLAKNMVAWKAWEPLVEEAPKNQWKWPV
ncbi:NADH dehydrogenase [ubiquinone] 1 alpha subcomplex subunit 5-like [Mytilus californianus]|uniref:NADH dehydrogenase [ubiquinone] 1 alpha subcomplex subunit 5-like n=1 Tax=Mytilus californianus TaxID=6549 RepID=UPI0022459BC2|nr:NADH dehydrogenase [ubiquinone] 1 alpha subcomplex subunit 5-like [Mytilus californianus]